MAKYASTGVVLQRFNGSTFDAVAQVRDLSGASLSSEVTDVTTHDSANNWREKLSTLKDGGEISAELIFDPALAGHTAILGDLGGAVTNYRIVFPNTGTNTIWECPVIVTGFDVSNPLDDALTASITLTVAGEPNFTAS